MAKGIRPKRQAMVDKTLRIKPEVSADAPELYAVSPPPLTLVVTLVRKFVIN
jgi:hypothetical protein